VQTESADESVLGSHPPSTAFPSAVLLLLCHWAEVVVEDRAPVVNEKRSEGDGGDDWNRVSVRVDSNMEDFGREEAVDCCIGTLSIT